MRSGLFSPEVLAHYLKVLSILYTSMRSGLFSPEVRGLHLLDSTTGHRHFNEVRAVQPGSTLFQLEFSLDYDLNFNEVRAVQPGSTVEVKDGRNRPTRTSMRSGLFSPEVRLLSA